MLYYSAFLKKRHREYCKSMRNLIMAGWNETIYTCPQPSGSQPLFLELAGITHPDTSYRISRSGAEDIYVLEYVIRGRGRQPYSP